MKYEEALKITESMTISKDCEYVKTIDYRATIISALEKQIHKKVNYYGEDDDYTIECPNSMCQSNITEYENCGFSFCPDCGQKLDWSEEE